MPKTGIRDIGALTAIAELQSDMQLSGPRPRHLPPRMRTPPAATPKELETLQALALLRYADSSRLQAFHGVDQGTMSRRLTVLRSKKLVSWFRWVDEQEQDDDTVEPLASKAVYSLTARGVERLILSGRLKDDTHILTRAWRGRPVLHSQMPHQIGVSDIILHFSLAGRESRSHEFVDFIPDFVDREITFIEEGKEERKSISATFELYNTKHALKPDLVSHARAKISGKNFSLYFELERKSRTPHLIKEKFKNYSVVFASPKRHHNYGPPLLLYVTMDCVRETETEKRIKDLCSWARDLPIRPAFRVARLSDIKKNPLGEIWTKADGTTWSIER